MIKQRDINNIPDWVRWVAQDASGHWWGYEIEPQEHHCGWYENELGRCIPLKTEPANPAWRHTLQNISEILLN